MFGVIEVLVVVGYFDVQLVVYVLGIYGDCVFGDLGFQVVVDGVFDEGLGQQWW